MANFNDNNLWIISINSFKMHQIEKLIHYYNTHRSYECEMAAVQQTQWYATSTEKLCAIEAILVLNRTEQIVSLA